VTRLTILAVAFLLQSRDGVPGEHSSQINGNLAWHRRGEGFTASDEVDPLPVASAVRAYEAAFASAPNDHRTRFKLIEALYFQAWFAGADAVLQRSTWDRLIALTEEVIAQAEPDGKAEPLAAQGYLAEAHFWGAVSWGLYGMSHSYLASASKGVAGKIRHHAESLIELDPELGDAGGLRLLGRLHTLTPKIPLVTGWISRKKGIEFLERACAISTRDARNPYFLAEALLRFRPAERPRALAMLREVSQREPSPERIVEESEILADARAVLEHWEKKLGMTKSLDTAPATSKHAGLAGGAS